MIKHKKPDMSLLPGGYEPKRIDFDLEGSKESKVMDIDLLNTLLFRKTLSEKDINNLIGLMNTSNNFSDVSVQGRLDQPTDEIGSTRTTMWSIELAEKLGKLILKDIPSLSLNNYSPTDFYQQTDKMCYKWKPVGVSPLLRFMKYKNGGQHYTHYDAGYIYDKKYRTLMSMVIYLTTNKTGCTRFIEDNQSNIQTFCRNHDDWTTEATKDQVYESFTPVAGNILLFQHRIAHDVSKFIPEHPHDDRIIIRGDIIFKKK